MREWGVRDVIQSAQGTFLFSDGFAGIGMRSSVPQEAPMNGLIYLIGLIVVIMVVLSLLGLR
jgi:hypothetical protein